jgi:hypothetical protein
MTQAISPLPAEQQSLLRQHIAEMVYVLREKKTGGYAAVLTPAEYNQIEEELVKFITEYFFLTTNLPEIE